MEEMGVKLKSPTNQKGREEEEVRKGWRVSVIKVARAVGPLLGQ